MINPYEGVNWGTFQHIQSTSHMHHDRSFVSMAEDGFRHLPISNYYPSKPYDMTKLNTSDFHRLPEGCIISPNAEHHNSIVGNRRNGDFHFNSLGSTWESGRPKEEGYEGQYGVNDKWENAFDSILANLIYKDGGGITINHPNWYSYVENKLTLAQIQNFLDYDKRVLGIEILNAPVTDTEMGWALDVWDALLKTGRRVWGFCVTDHPKEEERPYQGRNVLLVNEFTEEECLKAYREGRFYGKTFNTELRFEEIKFENNVLTVRTNNATAITVVVDGKTETFKGTEVTYTVPIDAVYVRAEARTDTEYDYIFTNPFMLDPSVEPTTKRRTINKMMWF